MAVGAMGCLGHGMWKAGPNPLLSPPLTFPEVNQVPIRCWVNSERPSTLTTRPRHLSLSLQIYCIFIISVDLFLHLFINLYQLLFFCIYLIAMFSVNFRNLLYTSNLLLGNAGYSVCKILIILYQIISITKSA